MSTVIINGIEYVPAKTVTGTRAAAEPVDVRHLDRSFRFDPGAQQHIPTLLVEFEPVSAVGGGDPKAKGWRDRDLLAMMLRGQPIAHIAPAEQPQPEAVPARHVSVGTLSRMFEPLDGIDPNASGYHWRKGWNDALRRAMDYASAAPAEQPQSEAQPVACDEYCWLVELFEGDGSGNSAGFYHTGFVDIGGRSRTTRDPFKARRYGTRDQADAVATELGTTLTGTWRAVEHGFAAAPPPSAPEPSEAARLYIDGEWNSYRGELLSLALVGEDGSEWYEVIDFDGTPEPWVAANVMPKLRKAPISLEWMQGSLQRFLDRYPAGVHIVADWPEDIERFCRVLVTGPGQRLDTPPLTMEVVRIDPVSADPHNALADARALRDALRAAAAARTKC